MVNFISKDCEVEELDFFHSANYLVGSFSTKWETRTQPDADVSSTPVYELVLEQYGIPVQFPNGSPPGGTLPGIDLHRMDAFQAITFSLAESFLQGQWWEMYEDGEGGVYFQKVFDSGGPGKTVDLDVRLCIPAAAKANVVDMVVVRGYDAPPERYAGETKNVVPRGAGIVNPTSVSPGLFTVDQQALVGGCLGAKLGGTAVKSYPDPILTNAWGPQETNPFYDLKAYEQIITHAVTIDGPPGKEEAGRVTYTFNDAETTWYYPIPTFPSFARATMESIHPECDGFQTGGDITFYKGSFSYTSPWFIDRYGYQWPFVSRPGTELMAVVYPIKSMSGGAPAAYGGGGWTVSLGAVPQFVKVPGDWFYTVRGVNQYSVTMYYQPDGVLADDWDLILSVMGGANGEVDFVAWQGTEYTGQTDVSFSQPIVGAIGGTGLGFAVSALWLSMTVAQPCVVVTDTMGNARAYSDALKVDSTPLIIKDLPVPIGYSYSGGAVELGPEELVESIPDSDPTTCQNFQTTPESLMQDRMGGNVIDVSFPFCKDAKECAFCASTIYDYQNFDVQTFTLTCGPNDEPELGAAVSKFNANLRIESISYSYQDGSSYNIEVTLGPHFVNVGSWGANGPWIRQVEGVDRPGIITWSAGNGADYRVYVQGMGDYSAINSGDQVWRTGEVVQVSIKNVPKETM